MARSINKRLRVASFLALLVGAFFAVKAMDKDSDVSVDKLAPTDTYYNSGNGVYVPTPPSSDANSCAEPDPYPCSIVLNSPIESGSFIYRGSGNTQNTLPPEAGGVKSEHPDDRYNLY